MVKHKQSNRLNQYANLAAKKPKQRKRTKKSRGFDWFFKATRKQKIMMIAAPILAILIVIPLVTYLMLANDIKDPERLMNRNNTGIVLEDIHGESFYKLGRSERNSQLSLDKISTEMQQALIASEDKDFYKHGGFSAFSIVRALVTRTGGGSTLTQQLVKNNLLTDQQTFLRKYQELFMAIAVEQNYSKDEILTMYLNSAYFGENSFGVDDAAKAYFNKTPAELDLAESAMLVGLLPAPNAYSPISGNKDYAKQRQTTVLSRMVANDFINEGQKTAALAQELNYGQGATIANTTAPHFVEMVIDQLSQKYGYETIMRSGYQVKTSLDLTAQKALQDSLTAGMPHINAMGGSNASGIVVDPKSGEVRALVGSADYNNDVWGKVNMVTTARQPGSSFKPIYYAGALADGVITPATVLQDKVMDFGGGYVPRDADRNETSRGQATVRQSLDWSLNIPSIHVMEEYSIDKSISVANSLGISQVKRDQNHGLSLALGSVEVPLATMVKAYAAFANQGQQYDQQLVTQIDDKFGKKIFMSSKAAKQVINKEGAYLISNILSDNATRSRIFGTSLNIPGQTVAVKTGTTNDNRDAWTIGYNPQYVVGVWVGNNDNTAMRSGGSDMAGPIWRNTFTKLMSGQPNSQFPMPSTIVQRDVCSNNGGLADKKGPNTYVEFFMSGALPTLSCNAEPTMISVCDLSSGKVVSIDETKYDSTSYSKDVENCRPPQISVCDLSIGQVVTINSEDYSETKYSKDTAGCKKQVSTELISACNLSTLKIEQVDQQKYDSTKYTTNYTPGNGKNCTPTPQ